MKAGRSRARSGAVGPNARPLVRFAGWGRSPVNPLFLPAERDVLAQLAIHGNVDDGAAYPSVRTMARNTGRARSTVGAALEALAAFGIIAMVGRLRQEGRRGRKPLVWTINEVPASPDALAAIVRAVQAHRAAAPVRERREFGRATRPNRAARDHQGRFSPRGILAVRHGVPSLSVGHGKEQREQVGHESGTVRREVGGPPWPPRSATSPARSQRTAPKGRRGERTLPNARAVGELARLLLAARLEDRGHLVADLIRQGHPAGDIEAAIEIAYGVTPVMPLEIPDGASSPGPRVGGEQVGQGDREGGASGGDRVPWQPAASPEEFRARYGRLPLGFSVVDVEPIEPGIAAGAFGRPGVLSAAALSGRWWPAPRPAFLRDIPPSSIRLVAGPEEDAK